ncbi:MAG: hypothetical protein U0166_00110 [Acidobacteriota bacterium]
MKGRAIGAAALLSIAIHLPALRGDFVYDDRYYVVLNPSLGSVRDLPQILVHSSHHHLGLAGHWRPVAFLSWGLDMVTWGRGASGPRALPFHLTSILLHALVTALLGLAARPFAGEGPATMAAALFAVHPVHVESVAWISARSEILSLLFCLLAILALRIPAAGARSAAVGGLALLAYGSKESAFVLPAYLAVVGFAMKRRRAALAAPVLSALASLAAFVPLRNLIMSADPPVVVYYFEGAPFARRIVIALHVLDAYARMLLWPHPLRVEYFWPGRVPPPLGWIGGVAVLGATAALLASPRTRRSGGVLVLGLVALLPVSHLHKLGQLVAERLAYGASAAFCLVLALGLASIAARSRAIGTALFAGIVVVYGSLTLAQIPVWRSDVSLFENAVLHAPRSNLMHKALAGAYVAAGREDGAAREWAAALALDPADLEVRYDLALFQSNHGDDAGARRTLQSREIWNDERMGATGRELWDRLAR